MTQVEAAARDRAAPLSGWRDIATYLGRNQSTAKRWAAVGGLPVHRPSGSAGRKGVPVYAFAHELDAWLVGHRPQVPNAGPARGPAGKSSAVHFAKARLRRHAAVLAGGVLAGLVAVVGGLSVWQQSQPVAQVVSVLPAEIQQLYLDAAYLWPKRTPETLRAAEQLLLRVAEVAPDFGGVHADLATVYNLMVEYGVRAPEEGYGLSRAAAQRAIALDPGRASPYTVLGDIGVFWSRNYEQGLRHFERAATLDPDDAQNHHWHAAALMGMGRFEEAASEIAKARELEPSSRSIGVSRAMILLGLGQVDAARDALLQLIENEPGYRSPYRFLSFAELAQGNHQGYIDALQTRFTLTEDAAGLAVVDAGRQALEAADGTAMAAAMLAAARAGSLDAPVEPYFLAHLLALAGEWENAARQLGKTPTRHAFYYGIDPAFERPRGDPAFRQIIAEVGLPAIP